MSVQTYANFINGEWVPAASGETFENRSPADTSDLVGRFAASSSADVDRAVASAAEAYTTWRQVPAPKRADILLRAAQLFAERKDRFRARHDARDGQGRRRDRRRRAGSHRHGAADGRRGPPPATARRRPPSCATSSRCRSASRSACAGSSRAWNFPIAVPSWKIFPALICGNTVVLKPAEEAPLSAVNFVQTLADAGLPAGVRQPRDRRRRRGPARPSSAIRTSASSRSPDRPRPAGSSTRRRAPSFKKVHLEMGGKNAIIVLDDADLELAVDGCLWGGFGTTGQRCTAASRVIVQKALPPLPRALRRAGAGPEGRQRPRGRRPDGAVDHRGAAAEGRRLRRHRPARGRDARDRRPSPDGGDWAQGLVPRADHLRRRVADDAHRPGGDLRAGRLGDPVRRARRRHPDRQRRGLRPVRRHLHPRRQRRVHRDARRRHRASSTSTRRPSAPRCTCRSAASRPPATATAKRASPRSTYSRNGSRSTSTSAAACSGRRWTPSGRSERNHADAPADERHAAAGLARERFHRGDLPGGEGAAATASCRMRCRARGRSSRPWSTRCSGPA